MSHLGGKIVVLYSDIKTASDNDKEFKQTNVFQSFFWCSDKRYCNTRLSHNIETSQNNSRSYNLRVLCFTEGVKGKDICENLSAIKIYFRFLFLKCPFLTSTTERYLQCFGNPLDKQSLGWPLFKIQKKAWRKYDKEYVSFGFLFFSFAFPRNKMVYFYNKVSPERLKCRGTN